jgi:peptidoglycan/LPS O-acetylase OafA/YrhL
VRRVVRLEPPYLVSIFLVLVLTLVASLIPQFKGTTDGLMDPWRIAAHLFYLIPLTGYEWLQPVYWTLAFEFAFYLSIGILFPAVAGNRQRGSFFLLSVACWLGVAFIGLPARVLLFVMGFAVFRRLILGDPALRNLLIVAASFVVMAYTGAWLEASVGSVVVLSLWHHDRLPALPGRLAKSLGGLGLISYSLYLIHVPVGGRVVNLGKRFIDSEWQYLLLSIFALLVCFFVAALICRLVELPAQKFARTVSLGRDNVLLPTH